MSGRIFVIGLDGATFDVLRPWIEQGWLPTMASLLEEGVHGELESTIPPMTAPAWSSFMTGKNPGKHGIYDFGTQERDGYGYQVIDARFRRGRALWDVIGEHGGRVVVLNVPTTYPPQAANGVLAGDFLTPSGRRDFMYPPGLLGEIERRFGPYPLYVVPPYFAITQADADIERFIAEYERALEYTFALSDYLVDRIDPQFVMLHLFGSDQICHWLWHILDPAHPQHQPENHRKHFQRIVRYFQRFDAELGLLLRRAGPEATTIVMSDHGFGALDKVINLNTWLIREGYLVLKRDWRARLRRLLWEVGFTPENLAGNRLTRFVLSKVLGRLVRSGRGTVDQVKEFNVWQRYLLSLDDVDWARTRAYCLFGWGQIRINVKGRCRQGCVAPGPEYVALRSEIAGKLEALRDPDTGEPVGGRVFTREEIYAGECLDDAPDLTFLPLARNYWGNSRGTGFLSNRVFARFLWGMTGMHRMNGILLGRGPQLQRGVRVDSARLIDLFPTILYLMGLPIPGDVDGRVLVPAVRPEFLKAHPAALASAADRPVGTAPVTVEDGQEEVIERLRNLGYL